MTIPAKKVFLPFFTFLLVFSLFPFIASAQAACTGGEGELKNPLAHLNICSVFDLMYWATNLLLSFVGFIATIAIVISGYQMIMSGGNPEQLSAAKTRITWAVVGLIITVFAYSVIRIVASLIAN